MGGTVVGRAMLQAYRQAIVSDCSLPPLAKLPSFLSSASTSSMYPGCTVPFQMQLSFHLDASKTGAAQEAMNGIKRATSSKAMTEHEARQILGITENSTWEEIVKV
jgi:mitochondrial import inner membrane translocase subunit TIM16